MNKIYKDKKFKDLLLSKTRKFGAPSVKSIPSMINIFLKKLQNENKIQMDGENLFFFIKIKKYLICKNNLNSGNSVIAYFGFLFFI
jgi:hypothetical protein